MGYFPNGTSGMDYEERYCNRCVHQNGCAIWEAHMLRNYDECNNEGSILHMLIPRRGTSNGKCKMFIAHTDLRKRKQDARQLKMEV